MPLDPQAAELLAALDARGRPPFHTLSVPEARDVGRAYRKLQPPPVEVAAVADRTVPGPAGSLPIRIYTPPGSPRGVLVWFHGGGFVIGDVQVADGPCRAIAAAAGCVVVSVEYRLAPESAFPAAPEDCYAVTRWVAEHRAELVADPAGVVVGGDSAGGNLAAAVCLMARDRGGPALAGQVLVYPSSDLADDDTPSFRDNGRGYLLTADSVRWFHAHYLARPEDARHPYASPALACDHTGLPPAFVATMEFDPLRDAGERYGEILRAAGVAVTVVRYAGQIHALLWLGGRCDRYRDLVADVGRAVTEWLGGPHPGQTTP